MNLFETSLPSIFSRDLASRSISVFTNDLNNAGEYNLKIKWILNNGD